MVSLNLLEDVSKLKSPTSPEVGEVISTIKSIVAGIVKADTDQNVSAINQLITSITDSQTSKIDDGIARLAKVNEDTQATTSGFVDDLLEAVREVLAYELNLVLSPISGILDKLRSAIVDGVSKIRSAIDSMADSLRSVINTIRNSINQAINAFRDTLSSAVEDIVAGVGGFIAGLVNSVKGWLASTLENIRNWITQAYQNVKEWFGGVIQYLRESTQYLIDTLKRQYEATKETIEKVFREAFEYLRQSWEDYKQEWLNRLQTAADWIAHNFLPFWSSAIDWAQRISKLDPSVIEDLRRGDLSRLMDGISNIFEWGGKAAVDSPIFAFFSAMAYFWMSVSLQFVPAEVAAQAQAQISLALTPLDMQSAVQAVFRQVWGEADFLENARLAAMTPDRARVALESSRPLLTPGQVQEAFLRGEISEDEHDKLLSKYGFKEDDIKLIKTLYFFVPSVSDLVRMAVREAFTPDIAQKFGQYEDYPEIFTRWAKAQGVSEQWAKAYWASHWDLPSPEMGFEMLHRGIITDDELKLLLRALDVMPFWREKLIQLSYNPYTRVDVRRMYQTGILTEDDVYKSYRDLGYDDEHARNLTEFTKRYSAPEDETELDQYKQLARSVYSNAYRRRIISEDEYRQFLATLKIHPDDINLLIALDNYAIADQEKLFDLDDYRKNYRKLVLSAYEKGILAREDAISILNDLSYTSIEINLELSAIDYEIDLRYRDLLVDRLHEQYTTYLINTQGVYEIFSSFNFTDTEITRLLNEWELERSFRVRRPSMTDIQKFYKSGLLTLEEVLDELRGLGYHERYIDYYRQLLS